MNCALIISIDTENSMDIKGSTGSARMVQLAGSSKCELFEGAILPGSTSTHVYKDGILRINFAYMLQGIDYSGKSCTIFVEDTAYVQKNKAKSTQSKIKEPITTHPAIFTTSSALSWLETEPLIGEITLHKGKICISIKAESC